MSGISRKATLSLYRKMLQEGAKFKNYNFREYTQRRVREEFKENKNITDPKQIEALLEKAKKNLAIIQRQATISQFYQQHPTVLEVENNAQNR